MRLELCTACTRVSSERLCDLSTVLSSSPTILILSSPVLPVFFTQFVFLLSPLDRPPDVVTIAAAAAPSLVVRQFAPSLCVRLTQSSSDLGHTKYQPHFASTSVPSTMYSEHVHTPPCTLYLACYHHHFAVTDPRARTATSKIHESQSKRVLRRGQWALLVVEQ